MNCPGCHEDVHPVQELQQNGRLFTSRCPRIGCETPLPMPGPVEVMLDEDGLRTVRIEAPQPAVLRYDLQTIATPQPAQGRVTEVSAPTDFIGQARQRLVAIEAQFGELDRLQREARKLRAMIAAADAADADELN